MPCLTEQKALRLAWDALAAIGATPAARVHAARPGVCAGAVLFGTGRTVLFRRIDGAVRMEVWEPAEGEEDSEAEVYELPACVQELAAAVIDRRMA